MTSLLLKRIKNFRPGQGLVVGVPYVWLLLLFLIPFAIVLKISFAEQALAIPPYTPLYTVDGDMGRVNVALSYINYSDIFRDFFGSLWQMFKGGRGDNIYLLTYWLSIKTALTTTIICLLLGYPIAYYIARSEQKKQNALILVITIPMWINMLVRTYAWIGLLSDGGLIQRILHMVGLGKGSLLYTEGAVLLGMVYNFLPFMILQIQTSLSKMDNSLLEASADLGASPAQTFKRVTLPLSVPGIINGITLVFLPAVSSFFIPKLLGGGQYFLIGNMIENQFITVGEWNFGSAISMIMAVIMMVLMMVVRKIEIRNQGGKGV